MHLSLVEDNEKSVFKGWCALLSCVLKSIDRRDPLRTKNSLIDLQVGYETMLSSLSSIGRRTGAVAIGLIIRWILAVYSTVQEGNINLDSLSVFEGIKTVFNGPFHIKDNLLYLSCQKTIAPHRHFDFLEALRTQHNFSTSDNHIFSYLVQRASPSKPLVIGLTIDRLFEILANPRLFDCLPEPQTTMIAINLRQGTRSISDLISVTYKIPSTWVSLNAGLLSTQEQEPEQEKELLNRNKPKQNSEVNDRKDSVQISVHKNKPFVIKLSTKTIEAFKEIQPIEELSEVSINDADYSLNAHASQYNPLSSKGHRAQKRPSRKLGRALSTIKQKPVMDFDKYSAFTASTSPYTDNSSQQVNKPALSVKSQSQSPVGRDDHNKFRIRNKSPKPVNNYLMSTSNQISSDKIARNQVNPKKDSFLETPDRRRDKILPEEPNLILIPSRNKASPKQQHKVFSVLENRSSNSTESATLPQGNEKIQKGFFQFRPR